MNKGYLFYIFFCFIIAQPVYADQSSKHQKLLELMNILGIQKVFKDQKQSCLKQADSYSPGYIFNQQPEFFGGIDPDDLRFLIQLCQKDL